MSRNGTGWRNWGRTQRVQPRLAVAPDSVAGVQETVRTAAEQGVRIKAVGAGHSFSPIAEAPDVQLSLRNLRGLRGVDPENGHVRLAAGTHLYELPRLLEPHGLALVNMGDIDRQTVAGATSTGTHGTGGSFGGLATQIVAMTLVTANGELIRISDVENTELLPAARVGLGALGIIVDITIACVPAYLLHAVEQPEPLRVVLDEYLHRSEHEDHFEFYWFPHTETALTKTNTRLPLTARRAPLSKARRWIDDELVANSLFRGVCAAATRAPAIIPTVSRLAQRVTGNREFCDVSPNVFVTNRAVRFREMEYAVPRDAVPEAFTEVKRLIDRRRWRISFPIEVRCAAADTSWLSTAYGRPTGYIAVHRYYWENPDEYFRAVEDIMTAYGGRPHWGKMHYQDAASLHEIYPHFADFVAVRDRLDPERRFTNDYLRRVLGSY